MIDEKLIKRALQLFIRFLKEENIIGVFNRDFSNCLKHYNKVQYIKYCSSYSSYVLDAAHRHSEILYNDNIHCLFLDYAMEWDKTEKGFEFWANVNRKWRECFFKNLESIKKETNEKQKNYQEIQH